MKVGMSREGVLCQSNWIKVNKVCFVNQIGTRCALSIKLD